MIGSDGIMGLLLSFAEADFHPYCSPPKTLTHGRERDNEKLYAHTFLLCTYTYLALFLIFDLINIVIGENTSYQKYRTCQRSFLVLIFMCSLSTLPCELMLNVSVYLIKSKMHITTSDNVK